MRVASTGGVELAVHDLGGDGPPILFSHATGFHGMVWAPLAQRLADRFRCWSVDFRGHGDSTSPEELENLWLGFGEDVLAVVDALELSHPFGVGHSKGGASLLLAEQARPGTFRSLYVYEPIVFPVAMRPPGMEGPNPMADAARRRREVFDSYDTAIANYASKPPLSALHPDALRAYVEHGFALQEDGRVRLKCPGAFEAAVFDGSASHGAFERLGEVHCPVTVAAGGSEEASPAMIAPLVAEALPAGRLEMHERLGHFGPLEDPDSLADAISHAFAGT